MSHENFKYPEEHPEFKKLTTPLTETAMYALDLSVCHEGVRDKIVTWKNYILDGHHRIEICKKYGIVDFELYTPPDINSEEDAQLWIINNQIQRCDLSKRRQRYITGYAYFLLKKTHGGNRRSNLQSEDLKGKTADILSEEKNISRSSVERAHKFYLAVDQLSKECSKTSDWFLNDDNTLSMSNIVSISENYSPEIQKEIIDLFDKGIIKSLSDYQVKTVPAAETYKTTVQQKDKFTKSENVEEDIQTKISVLSSDDLIIANEVNQLIDYEPGNEASEVCSTVKTIITGSHYQKQSYPSWLKKQTKKTTVETKEISSIDAFLTNALNDALNRPDGYIVVGYKDSVQKIFISSVRE